MKSLKSAAPSTTHFREELGRQRIPTHVAQRGYQRMSHNHTPTHRFHRGDHSFSLRPTNPGRTNERLRSLDSRHGQVDIPGYRERQKAAQNPHAVVKSLAAANFSNSVARTRCHHTTKVPFSGLGCHHLHKRIISTNVNRARS